MKFPLIHDHHTHLSLYTALVDCVDISTCCTLPELMARLVPLSCGRLNIVLGWDSSRLALNEKDLTLLPPVVVNDRSLHGFLMNEKAREMLIGRYSEIVANYRDEHYRERNVGRLMQMLVSHAGIDGTKLCRFIEQRKSEGICGITEMLLTDESLFALAEKTDMASAMSFFTDPAIYREFSPEAKKRTAGIKIFTDGSLGARTAALSTPYLCGRQGVLIYTDEELTEIFSEIASWGKRLAVHALGDLATSQVARVVARMARRGVELVKPRMEHAQFISVAAAHQLKELGFVLCMQPNFAMDSADYADRLSPAMCSRINPMRMLIDEVGFEPGKDLIFGSDGMPHGAEQALRAAFFPPYPSQRLIFEEFVAAYRGPLSDTGHMEISVDYGARHVRLDEVVWYEPRRLGEGV